MSRGSLEAAFMVACTAIGFTGGALAGYTGADAYNHPITKVVGHAKISDKLTTSQMVDLLDTPTSTGKLKDGTTVFFYQTKKWAVEVFLAPAPGQ